MSAIERLVEIADRFTYLPEHLWLKDLKPCEFYENLPEDVKNDLKTLKSSDTIRPDLINLTIQSCNYKNEWARGYKLRNRK